MEVERPQKERSRSSLLVKLALIAILLGFTLQIANGICPVP